MATDDDEHGKMTKLRREVDTLTVRLVTLRVAPTLDPIGPRPKGCFAVSVIYRGSDGGDGASRTFACTAAAAS